jgi:hypothetical protein
MLLSVNLDEDLIQKPLITQLPLFELLSKVVFEHLNQAAT